MNQNTNSDCNRIKNNSLLFIDKKFLNGIGIMNLELYDTNLYYNKKTTDNFLRLFYLIEFGFYIGDFFLIKK